MPKQAKTMKVHIFLNVSFPHIYYKLMAKTKIYKQQPKYINYSVHLAQKYARIFVCGHYLFWEVNSFLRV